VISKFLVAKLKNLRSKIIIEKAFWYYIYF